MAEELLLPVRWSVGSSGACAHHLKFCQSAPLPWPDWLCHPQQPCISAKLAQLLIWPSMRSMRPTGSQCSPHGQSRARSNEPPAIPWISFEATPQGPLRRGEMTPIAAAVSAKQRYPLAGCRSRHRPQLFVVATTFDRQTTAGRTHTDLHRRACLPALAGRLFSQRLPQGGALAP